MLVSSTSKNNEFAPVAWQDRAACLGVPIAVFFPEEVGVATNRQYDQARRYCDACEVRNECLAFAMHHERTQWRRFGMFGGVPPRERSRLEAEHPYRDWFERPLYG
jgi:WhiB family redox-sensing transcriptional regulator